MSLSEYSSLNLKVATLELFAEEFLLGVSPPGVLFGDLALLSSIALTEESFGDLSPVLSAFLRFRQA